MLSTKAKIKMNNIGFSPERTVRTGTRGHRCQHDGQSAGKNHRQSSFDQKDQHHDQNCRKNLCSRIQPVYYRLARVIASE